MYKVRLFDEGWSAKYWSNQWNTWFPCQDLVVGNIPNTKERSHQPTSDCNAPCSSKQGVKYSVLLFICYNCLKISLLFYVCLHFCICVCVYYVHAWCPRRPEEGVRSPGTGVTGGCEPSCGCWQPHSPLQEELQVLLADELLSSLIEVIS